MKNLKKVLVAGLCMFSLSANAMNSTGSFSFVRINSVAVVSSNFSADGKAYYQIVGTSSSNQTSSALAHVSLSNSTILQNCLLMANLTNLSRAPYSLQKTAFTIQLKAGLIEYCNVVQYN